MTKNQCKTSSYTAGPISDGGMDPRNLSNQAAQAIQSPLPRYDDLLALARAAAEINPYGDDANIRDLARSLLKGDQKTQPNQPSSPISGWLQALDEEMVCTHLGVADKSDTFEQAKKKLRALIDWHVAVATDPAVNGGQELVRLEPVYFARYTRHGYWRHCTKERMDELKASNEPARSVWDFMTLYRKIDTTKDHL